MRFFTKEVINVNKRLLKNVVDKYTKLLKLNEQNLE